MLAKPCWLTHCTFPWRYWLSIWWTCVLSQRWVRNSIGLLSLDSKLLVLKLSTPTYSFPHSHSILWLTSQKSSSTQLPNLETLIYLPFLTTCCHSSKPSQMSVTLSHHLPALGPALCISFLYSIATAPPLLIPLSSWPCFLSFKSSSLLIHTSHPYIKTSIFSVTLNQRPC